MAFYDNEKHMNHVFKEFSNIDKFHKNFRDKFSRVLNKTILQYNFKNDISNKAITIIDTYSAHLLSTIESVIDKDKNYSEYRLMIELHRMNKVLHKISKPKYKTDFGCVVENIIKKMTIDYYPLIVDFTANGFRLLDVNLQVFIRDFLTDLYFDMDKNTDIVSS